MNYQIEDVFSPRSFPQNTYIMRKLNNEETVDDKLNKALKMKGNLIFISGASKSGKTVLCKSVIPEGKAIDLSGNQICSREDFWSHIAEQIPLSDTVTTTTSVQTSENKGDNGSISLNLGVLKVQAGANNSQNNTDGSQVAYSKARTEREIIKYLLDNNKVLIIDDFHYIAKDVQMYIARTLKTELFNGLKAVILSLPHRSNEAITLNPDLIGRTTSIDIPPWHADELKEIAIKGFNLLNIDITANLISLLATESISSPQLMQDNCFNLAYRAEKTKTVTMEMVHSAFKETASNYSHYNEIVNAVGNGPLQGLNRRKQYMVKSESVDIYQLLLLALKADPPVSEITLKDLKERFMRSTDDAANITSSIVSGTVNKAIKLIKDKMPELDSLEYKNSRLYILDPFLLFYLRWKN